MDGHVTTVALRCRYRRPCAVEVQVQTTPGLVAFIIAGLPDKAVGGKPRARAPRSMRAASRFRPDASIVNLAPADLPGRKAATTTSRSPPLLMATPRRHSAGDRLEDFVVSRRAGPRRHTSSPVAGALPSAHRPPTAWGAGLVPPCVSGL